MSDSPENLQLHMGSPKRMWVWFFWRQPTGVVQGCKTGDGNSLVGLGNPAVEINLIRWAMHPIVVHVGHRFYFFRKWDWKNARCLSVKSFSISSLPSIRL